MTGLDDDDPERWGLRQRRKGGLRVLGAGGLALVAAAIAWLLSSSTLGVAIAARLRFVAVGAAAVGIALVIGGAILLVRAGTPPDADQRP